MEEKLKTIIATYKKLGTQKIDISVVVKKLEEIIPKQFFCAKCKEEVLLPFDISTPSKDLFIVPICECEKTTE
jgi:hypothetical protein